MEITIYDKVYKSGKTTMGTLRKVTELAKLVEERERISLGDDEDAQLKLIESIDPLTDIDKNVELICEYFNHQFTVEDFMNGYQVDSIQDYHLVLYDILFEALRGVTVNLSNQKKSVKKTVKKKSQSENS